MKQQPSEIAELTAPSCPDHGRQPACVKGKGFARATRALDAHRQSVGMNQTAGGGPKCREARAMTAHEQVRKQDHQDREFTREAALMLSRLGYQVVISGNRIKALTKGERRAINP